MLRAYRVSYLGLRTGKPIRRGLVGLRKCFSNKPRKILKTRHNVGKNEPEKTRKEPDFEPAIAGNEPG